jgi:error-prone DNA polymerase
MSEGYAELHCLSAFSFQRGASTADELFARARHHAYSALAITDECSLAGIVRALRASEASGVPLIVGSEIQLEAGPRLVLLVEDDNGYRSLCWLITQARRRADKGQYRLLAEDLDQVDRSGLLALWLPPALPEPAHGCRMREWFPDRCWIAVELHHGADDPGRLQLLQRLGAELGMPLVASGDVHMHARGRRALQDVMTAIRHRVTVADAGHLLFPNGERHLRPLSALRSIYPSALLRETLRIAARCTGFDLRKAVDYLYPSELVPAGHTPQSWLAELVRKGACRRWPQGTSPQAQALIDKELALIAHKRYASYFLTVHDLVAHARSLGILCQGRGSAANSVVCFVLGITELDPSHSHLLFERFISEDRDEPPDIDVDFEHERREEVIQYVFARYGRERAALAAVATQYGGRGAIRDVARVLGMPGDAISRLTSCIGQWSDRLPDGERLREHGFDPDSPLLHRILVLAGELIDFPHYLSQHPGGFVISERPLHSMVPVENAAMAARTVIQWDKDDLEFLGLMKVDVLALGMLTAVRRCFDLIRHHRGRQLTLATIPQEDADTYAMISRADTVGVFQIESRAQMAMLPRLRPQTFYDLVIEVAIVRPGPIQGDMVHPYLRRRTGEEQVSYPSPALEQVLERTLGVPLFQEQVMQIAMVAAGYNASEADALRRSMAAWKRHGGLEHHRERLTAGMLARGYPLEFAERIFEQIKGFGSYGFPESHAASFALIAYASSWLKCHYPAEFACALLNSQPMGFYSPDQLLQDVRRHGVATRPLDVRYSGWDCSLEPERDGRHLAIRLGFCLVRGFNQADVLRIEQARAQRAFADVADLCQRAALDGRTRALLADSGALRGMAGHRHRARWVVAGVEAMRPLFQGLAETDEAAVALPMPSAGEDLVADYALLGTTLSAHPLSRLRAQLRARRCRSSNDLATMPAAGHVVVAGLVRGRQRPQTASGVTFLTLEDEFGQINVVVWRQLAERQRQVFLESRLMQVSGRLEVENDVRHLVARRLEDLTPLLGGLDVQSRDFH